MEKAIEAPLPQKKVQHISSQKEIDVVNRRITVVEERLETIRSHIDILDKNIIEKHKSNLGAIERIETDMRSLRADIQQTNELMQRLVKRSQEFATREEVKVLEKYINIWQPLKFTTKEDVLDIIKRNK